MDIHLGEVTPAGCQMRKMCTAWRCPPTNLLRDVSPCTRPHSFFQRPRRGSWAALGNARSKMLPLFGLDGHSGVQQERLRSCGY